MKRTRTKSPIPSKVGRPSKLTNKVKDKLVEAISHGNYYEAACQYAGITFSTFRNWMLKGEEETKGEYLEFFETIKKAEAQAEIRMVEEWQKHIPNNWQAAATFMERRYPNRWGRLDRSKVELTGADGGPIEHQITDGKIKEAYDKLYDGEKK